MLRAPLAIRILLLFIYGIYALSPIYASATVGCTDRLHNQREHLSHYTVGIVWVDVLLSELQEDDGDNAASPSAVAAPDPEHFLIKKKRAVLREQPAVTPPVSVARTFPALAETAVPVSYITDAPLDLKHHESDGFSSLHAGLSPPHPLS